LSGKNRPGDSCELVRECDDNLVAVSSFPFHCVYPKAEVVLRPVEMQHARTGAVNKQLAQIWIPEMSCPLLLNFDQLIPKSPSDTALPVDRRLRRLRRLRLLTTGQNNCLGRSCCLTPSTPYPEREPALRRRCSSHAKSKDGFCRTVKRFSKLTGFEKR
jgi:hypothetical protein